MNESQSPQRPKRRPSRKRLTKKERQLKKLLLLPSGINKLLGGITKLLLTVKMKKKLVSPTLSVTSIGL